MLEKGLAHCLQALRRTCFVHIYNFNSSNHKLKTIQLWERLLELT